MNTDLRLTLHKDYFKTELSFVVLAVGNFATKDSLRRKRKQFHRLLKIANDLLRLLLEY